MAAVLRTEIELSYTGQEAILWFSGLPAQLGSLQAALKLAGSATLHLVCACVHHLPAELMQPPSRSSPGSCRTAAAGTRSSPW